MGNLLKVRKDTLLMQRSKKKSKGDRLGWIPSNEYKRTLVRCIVGKGNRINANNNSNPSILLVP